MPRTNLRLDDPEGLNDRELLQIVDRNRDTKQSIRDPKDMTSTMDNPLYGWTSLDDVLAECEVVGKTPRRAVASRLSKLAYYCHVVEKSPNLKGANEESVWRLTPEGQAVVNARLSSAQSSTIRGMDDSQGIAALEIQGDMYRRATRPFRNMMRRQVTRTIKIYREG